MKIFSGSSNIPLAESIAKELNLQLSPIEIHVFPDGERRIKLNADVVEEDVVLIQSTATPVDQNYMELLFISDALKRSGARSVTAVVPYLGYQRQDHVFRTGEAVSLDVVIKMLESVGIDKVISLDLHSIKIPELFHIPIIEVSALPLFAEKIKSLLNSDAGPVSLHPHPTSSSMRTAGARRGTPALATRSQFENSVLVSPDMGGIRRIKIISELLNNMPFIETVKDRDLETGEIKIEKIEGLDKESELNGKTALIVDDMISSGITIIKSAELLKKNGVTEVFVFVTHPIFSEDAPDLLQKSVIDKVYVTDSVLVPEEKRFPKLEIISVSDMIAGELQKS